MSLDPELRAMFNQEVTLRRRAGTDAYGQPAWDEPVLFRARVETSHRLIRDSQGNLITVTATVFTADAPEIKHTDRLVLPSGRSTEVIGVDSMPDENGEEYYLAVYVG
jgi:hypothetical protein